MARNSKSKGVGVGAAAGTRTNCWKELSPCTTSIVSLTIRLKPDTWQPKNMIWKMQVGRHVKHRTQ